MKGKLDLPLDKRVWSPSPLPGQIVLVTTLNGDGQSNVAPKNWLSPWDPYEYLRLFAFLESGVYGVVEKARRLEAKDPEIGGRRGSSDV